MISRSVMQRFRYFFGQTGGEVGRAADIALRLARAYEAAHDDETLEFVWDYDQDPDISWMDTEQLKDLHEGRTEMLVVRLDRKCPEHGVECKHAETLAALGGIHTSASDHLYRDIVEGELAYEAGIR